MNNITNLSDCFGCGVCVIACPQKLISLKLNKQGFYQPQIDNVDACSNCGLCTSVCAFKNIEETPLPLNSFAAWSKNNHSRIQSTSGGVSFEIGKYLLENGYKFCGAKYNAELNRVEHYIARNEKELEQSRGSKYLQSFTSEAFSNLRKNEKYVVVGTPCQIASFRRYIQKFRCEDNYLLVDFFCHGVPSKLMWNRYLEENRINYKSIKEVSWRNKEKGWLKSYCIRIKGENFTYQSWIGKDDFFTLFLGDACLGKACYRSCRFKHKHSFADIRLGDFWGDQYKTENDGVCAVVSFSNKGNEILHNLNIQLTEHEFETVSNKQMKDCASEPWYYNISMTMIEKGFSLKPIASIVRVNNIWHVLIKKILK